MNVLVTGGRGFLGRRVVDILVARGHTVVAPGHDDLDLASATATQAWWPPMPVDGIVHVAALVGGLGFVNTRRLEVMSKNLAINLGAVALAEALEVKWFVGVGSACAYPESAEPLHESMLWAGPLHDSVFAYGTTKRALEALQRAWALENTRFSIHAILANLYGPGDLMEESRAHAATALVRRFVRAAAASTPEVKVWGDGSAEREFLYVDDAAAGLVTLAEHAQEKWALPPTPTRVNLGTGTSTSMRKFMDTLVKAANYQGKVVWDAQAPTGVGRKVLDVTTAKTRFGIEAKTSLEDGITKAVAWEALRL